MEVNRPVEKWKCVGASVRGTSHINSGLPCQDFSEWRAGLFGEERVLLVGIADGAGSAECSEEGSRLVVKTILTEAGRHTGSLAKIDREHAEQWLEATRRRLQLEAESHGGILADYASTMLLAILGDKRSIFVQLGDGGWVVEADRGHEAATWPTTGEYANQTIFVTSPSGVEEMQFVVFD